jgi:tetratricopeptide (TPR) repeat protein
MKRKGFGFLIILVAFTVQVSLFADDNFGNTEFTVEILKQGITAAMDQDFDTAIVEFTKIIEASPDSAMAYLQRGKAYFASSIKVLKIYGDFEAFDYDASSLNRENLNRAGADFNKALEIANLDQSLNHSDFISDVEYFLGQEMNCRKENDRALELFSSVLRNNPSNAYAYASRGTEYFNRKEYEKALHDFTLAVTAKPDYAMAYALQSVAQYALSGNIESFISHIDYAIKLDPEYKAIGDMKDELVNAHVRAVDNIKTKTTLKMIFLPLGIGLLFFIIAAFVKPTAIKIVLSVVSSLFVCNAFIFLVGMLPDSKILTTISFFVGLGLDFLLLALICCAIDPEMDSSIIWGDGINIKTVFLILLVELACFVVGIIPCMVSIHLLLPRLFGTDFDIPAGLEGFGLIIQYGRFFGLAFAGELSLVRKLRDRK